MEHDVKSVRHGVHDAPSAAAPSSDIATRNARLRLNGTLSLPSRSQTPCQQQQQRSAAPCRALLPALLGAAAGATWCFVEPTRPSRRVPCLGSWVRHPASWGLRARVAGSALCSFKLAHSPIIARCRSHRSHRGQGCQPGAPPLLLVQLPCPAALRPARAMPASLPCNVLPAWLAGASFRLSLICQSMLCRRSLPPQPMRRRQRRSRREQLRRLAA